MVNKVTLIGNLGKDPECKTTPTNAVTKASLATKEKWLDANKQAQEKTTWHNLVLWGKPAENFAKYTEKGSLVYVEGKIDNRSYDDKDGVKKYVSEVVVSSFKLLSYKETTQDNTNPEPVFNSSEEIPF